MSKRNLDAYIGRLPYASEMFGVYRPMIGWASKRKKDRILDADRNAISPYLLSLMSGYAPVMNMGPEEIGTDISDPELDIGVPYLGHRLSLTDQDEGTFLLPAVEELLIENGRREAPPANAEEWQAIITEDVLRDLLQENGPENKTSVERQWLHWLQQELSPSMIPPPQQSSVVEGGESKYEYERRRQAAIMNVRGIATSVLGRESQLAGALLTLVKSGAVEVLNSLFYAPVPTAEETAAKLAAMQERLTDPFLQFDPTDELNGVTVSPIGIVHLYRQYFFEFDSFLGPSVEHVWLPPGASAEFIETSSRKTTVERTITNEFESTTKTERDERVQDELSNAVRQENRHDTKLGFSTTVTQQWPAGSGTATGSLNLDSTQQMSREDVHKRLREQSIKLSTEIRNSFKTTFKTVTESTDTSSKRLVLQNPSDTAFQNYELRRKMRQVGVQVQDVGTYLCWETFVDEPGSGLGLANLVHVAKPPDVTPLPNPATIPIPERKSGVPFQIRAGWTGVDRKQKPEGRPYGIPLGRKEMPIDIPDGYEVDLNIGDMFQLQAASASGDGGESFRTHTYLAQYAGGRTLDVGLKWGADGLRWTHDISIELTGAVPLRVTGTRRQEIEAVNKKIISDHEAQSRAAEKTATDAAFYKAAQERIEQAAAIKQRNFEDLREEERTIVYRELIRDLMAKDSTTGDDNYSHIEDPKRRHVYATVINAIFDIDAMLYFVAPEWWKPRAHSDLVIGNNPNGHGSSIDSSHLVGWTDSVTRKDNYYITGKSEPARLGSSLGWLLQLDGDDNRNRFLNAPWVRAVIPIRPGKEKAAIKWLTNANVEGVEGLNSAYAYPKEYAEITEGLKARKVDVSNPPTLQEAITYLCLKVAEKHQESTTTSLYPGRDDVKPDDKVWSTPVEKVYEHGFYPLERSFVASPHEEHADSNNPNFQCCAQWTEILPTDQIVPMPVEYNAKDGRLKDGP